jgi:hypothetical protein
VLSSAGKTTRRGRMTDPSWSKHVAGMLRRSDIRLVGTVPDYIVSRVFGAPLG